MWAETKTEHASSCTTNLRQGPFTPPELPGFSATMNPSDFRRGQITVIDSRGSLPKCTAPDLSGSWRVCRYPPSSTTPGSCTAACARCFAVHIGFAIYGRLATPSFISRGRIRFTCVTADSFGKPRLHNTGSPRAVPGRLHGQRAVTMVRTFQQTRPVRLRLTHHNLHNE